MPEFAQRGFVHLLVVLLIFLGIAVGVYLVTSGRFTLTPHASTQNIWAVDSSGNPITVTTSAKVRIKVVQSKTISLNNNYPFYSLGLVPKVWAKECENDCGEDESGTARTAPTDDKGTSNDHIDKNDKGNDNSDDITAQQQAAIDQAACHDTGYTCTTTYHSDGSRTFTSQKSDGSSEAITYDSNGQVIKDVTTDINGTVITNIYEPLPTSYGEIMYLSSSTWVASSGDNSTTIYDTNGRVVRIDSVFTNQKITIKDTYDYYGMTSTLKQYSTHSYDGSGNEVYRNETSYDQNYHKTNELTEETAKDGSRKRTTTTFSLDGSTHSTVDTYPSDYIMEK